MTAVHATEDDWCFHTQCMLCFLMLIQCALQRVLLKLTKLMSSRIFMILIWQVKDTREVWPLCELLTVLKWWRSNEIKKATGLQPEWRDLSWNKSQLIHFVKSLTFRTLKQDTKMLKWEYKWCYSREERKLLERNRYQWDGGMCF